MLVYDCVWVCALEYLCSWRPEASDPSEARVTAGYQLLDIYAVTQTLEFYKSKYTLLTAETSLWPLVPVFTFAVWS